MASDVSPALDVVTRDGPPSSPTSVDDGVGTRASVSVCWIWEEGSFRWGARVRLDPLRVASAWGLTVNFAVPRPPVHLGPDGDDTTRRDAQGVHLDVR